MAPLLGVENAFAGRAAELRLAVLAYQFVLLLLVGDIFQLLDVELQCAQRLLTLRAAMGFVFSR